MAKLKLVADPTFKGVVSIPVAGAEPVNVEFTFKHRTKPALDEFVKSREGKTDTESVLDTVIGWELSDEFTPENVGLLCDNYAGAGLAIFRAYIDQLIAGKAKN